MKKQTLTFLMLFVLAGGFLSAPVAAQKKNKKKKGKQEMPKKKPVKKGEMKAYKDVITKEAKSDPGLFTVHFVDEKLYYEIPDRLLGKDMLLVSRIAQIPAGLSPYMNAGSKTSEQIVRWERRGKKIVLKGISYTNRADENDPIIQSVQQNNFEPIIYSFDIEAINKDSAASVIQVNELFIKDVPLLSGLNSGLKKKYKISSLDAKRSFLDTAKSFPQNVEVRHTLTYRAGEPPAQFKSGTVSMQMNQSMILLPDDKMMPRLYDERVGWFSLSHYDYSSDKLKADRKTYLKRWRLEPKDPAAYARGELTEPIKPIVYYLDPATPLKWRKYFIQGIQDWQTAFEAAGFKNAIIAKPAPTPEEDPGFSPEDVRYSVVRYVASTTRNAVGPSVADPRTGEILESDIIWYHNHLRSYRNRYLLETGAANPKARTLLTPEAEIGEMMRRVISHEIGHALGLPHNMKASSAYPTDSLRSGSFTQKYGIATTIMDYARYNYIAQPGDENIRFVRQLGPYDEYAINWGYRFYENAKTPEAELPALRKIIKDKEGDKMYMFGGRGGGIDPDSQTEGIGDDPVKASTYGLANLKIVSKNLVSWTATEGENHADLKELYGELVGVWSRYIGHAVTIVGGVNETLKTTDQQGVVYQTVPEAKQKEAMDFLNKNAFSVPEWLLDENILRRFERAGAVHRIRALQVRHLNNLLDAGRLQRLSEAEAFAGNQSYTLLEMLNDLSNGIWSETGRGQAINIYRRHLQRAHLERMEFLLTQEQRPIPREYRAYSSRTETDVSVSDIRPAVRSVLVNLQRKIRAASRLSRDQMTGIHLRDAAQRIELILNPKE